MWHIGEQQHMDRTRAMTKRERLDGEAKSERVGLAELHVAATVS